MHLKPCTPEKLPTRKLKWEAFLPKLGLAHALLARYDEKISPSEKKQNYSQAQHVIFRKKKISFALMCQLHRIVKEDPTSKFRTKQNWIGKEGCTIEQAYFLPPKPTSVPKLMKELKNYLHAKEKDPLVQLAIFFAQLLIIHPFMDGNGRVARLLIPLFLYEKKLTSSVKFFMDSYFKKHRTAYFEKLFAITTDGDWEGWIDFFLKGVIDTASSRKT
jgi:Fic family protein